MNKKCNLGIDIDNVISNFDEVLLKEFLKHDIKLRNTGIVNLFYNNTPLLLIDTTVIFLNSVRINSVPEQPRMGKDSFSGKT